MTEAKTRRRILKPYSHGELSTRHAAAQLGSGASVLDVYLLMRAERLPLPQPALRLWPRRAPAGTSSCRAVG